MIYSVLFRVTFILRLAIPGGSSEVFPGGAVVKNPPTNVGDERDAGLIPGSGRLPRVGKGSPLQYSCLENSLERGAWQAVQSMEVQSQTRLSLTLHTHTQAALNLHPHGLETSADRESFSQ